MQRAALFAATPAAIDDVREAVAAIERLVHAEPLPWRLDEAREIRARADALLEEWKAPPTQPSPAPTEATRVPVTWLDPARRDAGGAPLLVSDRLLRFGTSLPPKVPSSGPTLSVESAELLGIWGDESTGAGLVIGLADASTAGDVVAELDAGRPPSPLPGAQAWELVEWQEEQPPATFVERLEARAVRAFRLRLRAAEGDGLLRGYLLLIEKRSMRWRVCLTLEESGDDWRARAAADAVAAVVFTQLKVS